MSFYGIHLNIQDSNATPSNTFLADNTCVDNGNNLGWVFNNGPFLYLSGVSSTTALGTALGAANADVFAFNGDLQYLDIQDGIASGSTLPFYTRGSVDSGNNLNWDINPDAVTGIIAARGFTNLVTTESENYITVDSQVGTVQLGTPLIIANAVVDLTGQSVSTSSGTVTVTAGASGLPLGLSATGFIGTAIAKNTIDVAVTGLFSTGNIGTSLVRGSSLVPVIGLTSTSNLGNETVNTVQFNYNTVAALYDRRRTVYVNRRTTSQDRAVYVG